MGCACLISVGNKLHGVGVLRLQWMIQLGVDSKHTLRGVGPMALMLWLDWMMMMLSHSC
jgi:hypothetical protein